MHGPFRLTYKNKGKKGQQTKQDQTKTNLRSHAHISHHGNNVRGAFEQEVDWSYISATSRDREILNMPNERSNLPLQAQYLTIFVG